MKNVCASFETIKFRLTQFRINSSADATAAEAWGILDS